MYGNSIFGDATVIPDPSRATPVGSVVRAGTALPVTGHLARQIPLAATRGLTSVIGTVTSIPSGAVMPVGGRLPVAATAHRTLPLHLMRGLVAPILAPAYGARSQEHGVFQHPVFAGFGSPDGLYGYR